MHAVPSHERKDLCTRSMTSAWPNAEPISQYPVPSKISFARTAAQLMIACILRRSVMHSLHCVMLSKAQISSLFKAVQSETAIPPKEK